MNRQIFEELKAKCLVASIKQVPLHSQATLDWFDWFDAETKLGTKESRYTRKGHKAWGSALAAKHGPLVL